MPAVMTKFEPKSIAALSIVQWQSLIADCAGKAASSPFQAGYGNEVRSLVSPYLSGLAIEEAWLLQLNVGLFLLRKHASGGHSGYFAHVAASEALLAIENHIHSALQTEIATNQRERLLETIAYIRDTAISDELAPPAFLDIYVELWITLLSPMAHDHHLFKEELTRLDETAEAASTAVNGSSRDKANSSSHEEISESNAGSTGANEKSRVKTGQAFYTEALASDRGKSKDEGLFAYVARAWMRFWLNEDQEAWRLLEAAERHRLKPAQVLRFLRLLKDTGQWSRLEAWLSHCATERIGRSYGSVEEYGRYWDAVVEQLPRAEEKMWGAIMSLLPYSSSLYEEKLLRHGHWRQWVDYQLSLGSDPLDFRAKDLQPVVKEAPEALLPFYHQGVENYLLLKNRDGYKRAVKLLKRLGQIYKKLKREQQWEAYMDSFARRHSRLRALQEELRKGGLLP
jgi:hypothetical protein